MAHPELQKRIHRIVRRSGMRPRRVLEVGGYVDHRSLLHSKQLARAERWCINLVDQPRGTGIGHVVGTSNDMRMFADGRFDVVLSCAVHEHDKRFWLSMAEMRRVLRPGGLMVVCVPGFVRSPQDHDSATSTFKVHYKFDYYRFSRRAVREVLLEGLEDVKVVTLLDPPRLIGYGTKPLDTRPRALRVARRGLASARARLHRRGVRAGR